MKEVAIVLNTPSEIAKIKEADVIYADGGIRHQQKSKNTVAVVGDFDTSNPLDTVNTVKLSKEKDYTDGEMAVRLAATFGYDAVSIYGATGGRIEHILFNFNLLQIAENLGLKCCIIEKNCTIELVSGKFAKNIKKGANVSLYPFTNESTLTDGYGLYYPIHNLTLTKFDTVGISNYSVSNEIGFTVTKGKVLAIVYN